MSEIERAIESYEVEIRELKSELRLAKAEIRACEDENLRLQGMVEAFEICVRARK